MAKKTKNKKQLQPSSELSNEDIKLFNEFVQKINVKNQTGKEKQEDIVKLATICTEYLKNFMILGYNIDNERVFITYNNNQKDADSLNELLRQTFVNLMNNE